MGAGKMPFANYNELSDPTLKLTLFVCFVHGKNKIKICPSYLKMESIRNWVSLIFSARGQKPCYGWHSQRFLKFPAFPWRFPDKCKISPTHCINNFTHQTWWWSQPSSPHSSPPPIYLCFQQVTCSAHQGFWWHLEVQDAEVQLVNSHHLCHRC